jgi:hypothetical protein
VARLRRRYDRLPFPPAWDAVFDYRRRPDTTLNVMRAMRAAIVWQGHTGLDRLFQYVRYLGWLTRFPLDVVVNLRRYGAAARKHLGRNYPGQIADLVRVGFGIGVLPKDYYHGGMARHHGASAIFDYMPYTFYETVAGNLADWHDRGSSRLSADKLAFEQRCRAAGLASVETLVVVEPSPDAGAPPPLAPSRDILLKPGHGSQGHGIELWLRQPHGGFMRNDGKPADWTGLLDHARSIAVEHRCPILMQAREVNHPSLAEISGPALATTRFLTMLNETGEPEIAESFYRTSVDPSAPVDNFHAGGTFYVIDPATGRFKPGYAADFRDRPLTLDNHPVTGVRMAGDKHPGWEEMSGLALRLHRAFPDLFIVGWDIGYSARGALAVEANVPPGLTTTRQDSADGFIRTRRAELLAFHARKWLAAHTDPGSRWRPDTRLPASPAKRV